MKLNKKTALAVAFIILFLGSSFIAYLQLFSKPSPVKVMFETSLGNIELELDSDKAPITVNNFIKYVNLKFYDGTVFHRVVKNLTAQFWIVQGGGFTVDAKQKVTNSTIKLENTGLKNVKGTIAMARATNPDTATSQFFFNLLDHPFLNPSSSTYGYAVFGKVISGWDIVETIGGVKTGIKLIDNYPYSDWPLQDIVIKHAYVEK